MISIGKRIRFLRKKAGLTSKELGERAGVGPAKPANQITQYECGSRNPGRKTLKNIAAVLQVPAEYLSVPVPSTSEEMDIINYWLSEFPLDSEKETEHTES